MTETLNPEGASQAHADDFTQLLIDADVPITQAQIKDKFQAVSEDAELNILNDDEISPFWRQVKELITLPVLWLVQFLIQHVMPNSYLKTAGSVWLDIIAWGYDVSRKAASKAQGNIVFTRSTTDGALVIPAGTVINSKSIKNNVYQVKTLADATLADGVASLAVLCEALVNGDGHNLGAGYYIHPDQPINGISSVNNESDWLTLPGQETETDDDLRLRCRAKFLAVGNWHINAMYISIITTFAEIGVNQVFMQNEAPRGPGTANAFILMPTGEPSPTFLSDIQNHIMADGYHGLGDDIQVQAMPALPQDIIATLAFDDAATSLEKSTLLIQVENFIRAAFRENTEYTATLTMPHKTFAFSKLAAELHRQFPLLEQVSFNVDKIEHGLNVSRLNSLLVTEYV